MHSLHSKALQLARNFVQHKNIPFDVAYRWARNFLQEAFGLSSLQWAFKMFDSCPLHPTLDVWVEEFITHHKPLSRSVQRRFFWNQYFSLNEATLDPRPETEGMISLVLKTGIEPRTILDLGTGSGCIVLSLLEVFPKAYGIGVDIQSKALSAAHQNAYQLKLDHRVHWITSNWYEKLEDYGLKKESFDLIISNPPYISSDECLKLPPEVLWWDPKIALDGGKNGVDPYEIIIPNASSWLAYEGILVLEISAHTSITFLISLAKPYFSNISLFLDDFGRNRYLLLR
ncbi:release factor glutamine methyltransferase [Holospora obtusa F1]|uniref:Release factor glutamine methyltransferase n=1 Tax=Holospora obtusa F1 TaxID=1399147 RepID=W6TDZ4_HOLOB|nr:HemK/PrmC family methyltransferase [Holospora obtusa]ETZ07081.1 release factor glutamine methyltransferase [Holospora obtusa F1]